MDERNKKMNKIPTVKEIREYRLTHLWSDTLDQIFDMRDHYRPVPASKVARMIDKAFREYCELKPTSTQLQMTVEDFSHRAHICDMRWPVKITKGFPRKYLKKDDLKPMKKVKVELDAAAFEEFRALAEEADYPLSYYLHRVSDEIKSNPELKKKIAYSYRKEQRQKAAQAERKGKVKKVKC